jgi:hypothetical protein
MKIRLAKKIMAQQPYGCGGKMVNKAPHALLALAMARMVQQDASHVQVAEAGHRPPHHQGPAHDKHQAAFLMIS